MAIYRDLTIQESSDACFTLFTASTVELSSLIQTDRDTIIYADEIIVNGKVDAGSHRVRLVCRRLVFNADSSLCANGVDAPPQIKTKADPWPQAGRAPNGDGLNGENGNDGAPGVAGSPGGVIEVWADHLFGEARFFANGGAACLPQDGGDGQMGGNGVPGEHHVPLNRDGKANGRPAGRGGDVGLPGARVRGGDPGTVSVRLRQKPSDDLVPHLEARSGTPSFPAKPGQPGSAGIPGAPGSWYKMICEDIGPKSLNTLDAAFSEIAAPMRRNCFPSRPFDGERGANNTSGRLRDGEVRERQVNFPPDVVGTASLEIISDKEFGRQLDLSYVELALEAIENEYALHGADSNAQWVTRYSYLLPVIQAAASSSPALRDAAARLETLGARIGVGLDFFGFSRIHTVLLSYETYSEIIESTLLPALRTVDALWKSYRAEDENAKEKTTSLNIAIIQTEERIARIENHKKELIDRINSMIESHPDRRGTLVMLDLEVAACEAVLLEAKEELTAAIKRSYKGCDILGAIQAGAMIYAGVSTGAVGILNVASGTANLIQRISQTEAGSLGEFFESVYSLKEPLEELAKHANSVDDAVSQIQEGLARLKPDSPKLPQFVIERDKFDEVAEKFAEFAEAEGYRLAGHSFLDALQARNEAIVRYNGMLTELAEVCEARSALLRMIEMSRSAIARNMDPSGPEIILGMRRLLRETVLMTARMIHSERKALNYLLARDADVSVPMLNLGTLENAHARAREDWVMAKSRHEARIRREISPRALQLKMSHLVQPIAFETFKRTGVLNFSIRIDDPTYGVVLKHLPGLRVSGISLRFEGARVNPKAPQYVLWELTHNGHEIIYRKSGEFFHYAHNPITYTGMSDPVGAEPPGINPDVSESNIYAGVSPFASWLLNVRMDSEYLATDLSALQELTLHMSGYMLEG